MFKIEGTTITITKGDTLKALLHLHTGDGEEYIPTSGDVIRFALKSDYSDPDPLLYKVIDNRTMELRLESSETKQLTARNEPYVYDMQITIPNGDVITFIERALFYVTEEVD